MLHVFVETGRLSSYNFAVGKALELLERPRLHRLPELVVGDAV
jgi:hypothetical protein